MRPIYLDFNGSTPLAPQVRAAMQPFLLDHFGNPSSSHWAALGARDAIEEARGNVASLIACDPTEVVFTSGGTEANNLAIKGVYFAHREKFTKPHFVTSTIEHPSVSAPLRFLQRLGAEVTEVPVDRFGKVDPDEVRRTIRPNTVLISIMHSNNEVGTIQPIAEISAIAREHHVLMHTDAAQSVGKIVVDVEEMKVDFLTIAGHKLYGPKGIGAMYIREGVSLEPLLHGGDQEAGHRAGSESAMLAAGLGAACAISHEWLSSDQLLNLRDRFWNLLRQQFDNRILLNGHPSQRLPNTLNVSFPGQNGAEMLARLDAVAASTGSACHAGDVGGSPVLKAMGIADSIAVGAIRFSLGRTTTQDEIDDVVERLMALMDSCNVKEKARV